MTNESAAEIVSIKHFFWITHQIFDIFEGSQYQDDDAATAGVIVGLS